LLLLLKEEVVKQYTREPLIKRVDCQLSCWKSSFSEIEPPFIFENHLVGNRYGAVFFDRA